MVISIRCAGHNPREKAYSSLFLRMEFERAGHAAAPTNKIDTASRRKIFPSKFRVFHTLKKFHKPCEMWKDNLWKTGSPQAGKKGLWKSKKIYTEPVEKKSLMGQAETGFST